jgi:hypothetical protein
MNPLLQTLLAQKLGVTLPATESSEPGNLPPNDAATDPFMAALVASLSAEEEPPPPRQPIENIERYRRALRRARQQIEDDQEQLDAARRLIAYIGSIFGGCPECWGINNSCTACGGQGQPGSTPAQPELLDWAIPGLQQMGWRIVRESASHPYPQPIQNKE